MNNPMFDKIQSLYDDGNTTVNVILNSGEKFPLRLFISTSGDLCYFAKGKHTRGYRVYNIVNEIKEIVGVKTKKTSTPKERYIKNLQSFKKLFTTKTHSNLWTELQNGYRNLNIEEFEKMLNGTDDYEFYKTLCEYKKNRGLDLITENRYKTTTIQSNKPLPYSSQTQYEECIKNIRKHLDNKEKFSYHWKSNYDVSVSGNMDDEGFYRAWFSLEFRGCGNGHYYLLVNENQAVFCEDD